MFVLPSIADSLDEKVKDGLAIRNACTTSGRCPVCGCTPDLYLDRVGVRHLVFRHADDCPVLRDSYDWRDEGAA
jgi:hypothetical protein